MRTSLLLALLATGIPALTPQQVKDELDAHPWRPDPGMVVVGSPAPAATAPKPPTTGNAGTPATPETWQLQIAALSSLEAAKSEQKRVERIVGAGKVEIASEGSVNRVRLGSYPSKESAEAAREELRTKGIEGFPVRKP